MMYTEYNEVGAVVRVSKDAEMLIKDTWEFGGCVVDENNNYIGGAEWVYESYLSDESKYVTCTDTAKKKWWVSYYLQDGTQCGGTYMAKDDDELEAILEREHGDMYGGIADYGCYDDIE